MLTSPQLSPDFEALLRQAAWIGLKDDHPTVSFTSLFLALLHGHDPWSQWVQQTAKRTGVRLDRVLQRWKETGGQPPEFTLSKLAQIEGLPGRIEMTRSVSALVQEVSGAADLIGEYIYKSAHEEDLAAWGFRRERWAVLFYPRLERELPSEIQRYLPLHGPFLRPASVGIREALLWAGVLGDGKAVSAQNLVRGVILDGSNYAGEERYASAWFLEQLGGNIEALLGQPAPITPPPTSMLRLDTSAQELMDGAALFATCSRDREVHVRHLLLAALCWDRFPAPELLRGRWRVPELVAGLLEWGSKADIDDEDQLRELVGLVRAAREREEREVVLSNDAVGTDPDGIPLDQDHLDIRGDVRAMAAVLASSSLKPPLSVGLFGDWGSGKSYFMGLLRRRIADLAGASKLARAAGRPSSFHGDIVQIEFNAWQYMDANLWASIVTHIFDELSAALSKRNEALSGEDVAALASIQEEKVLLDRQQEQLTAQMKGLSRELEAVRKQQANPKLTRSDLEQELRDRWARDEVVTKGFEQVLGIDPKRMSVQDVKRELSSFHQVVKSIQTWAKDIARSPAKAVLVLALLAGPILAASLPGLPEWLTKAKGLTLGALAAFVAFAAQLRTIAGPAFQVIRQAMADARAVEDQARKRLTAKEQALLTAEQGLQQRQADLARRRQELQSLQDAASYKRFVLERAASSDYRTQLGLITTIHRDLKTLSAKLKTSEEPHVDRIILYIDDLDRCPPDRVVEVLQAVHLILSLDLFVVVVAVDSRWLLQSLDAYYRRHFGERRRRIGADEPGHRESDPQHYLEKIFQIPYAISPMTGPGFGSLVRSLLGRNVVRSAPAQTGSMQAGDRLASREPASNGQTRPAGTQRAADDFAANLTPRGLEITEDELENLQKLGAPDSGRLLGSPRSVKRMVNLYRIVRAGLDEDLLDEFVQGSYKLHQLLLAAVVGAPKETAVLFDEIFEGRITSREQLAEYLVAHGGQSDAWRSLERAFATQPLDDWRAVVEAARSAGRFSFQTGRVLQDVVVAPPLPTASPGTTAPPPTEKPPPF